MVSAPWLVPSRNAKWPAALSIRPPPLSLSVPPEIVTLFSRYTLLPLPTALIIPLLLLNWPPLSTSPPAAVASKSPWFTKPPPLALTTVLLVVGVMISALVAEVALITPADWLMNSIELLAPICPAPEIVLLTLVNVSAPLLVAPKMRLLGLSLKITLPPPVSIVPSAMRKSVKFAPALIKIVPVLLIVPFRNVPLLLVT